MLLTIRFFPRWPEGDAMALYALWFTSLPSMAGEENDDDYHGEARSTSFAVEYYEPLKEIDYKQYIKSRGWTLSDAKEETEFYQGDGRLIRRASTAAIIADAIMSDAFGSEYDHGKPLEIIDDKKNGRWIIKNTFPSFEELGGKVILGGAYFMVINKTSGEIEYVFVEQ